MATKLIVMTGFLIAFAAGLVTGLQKRPNIIVNSKPQLSTQPSTQRQIRPPAYFIEQLHLTRDQTAQWNKIWSEVADRGGRGQAERFMQLRQKRDNDIVALIPEASRSTYDKIQKDFSDTVEAMDKDWRDSYDEAVRKTKEILNDTQRRDYETILYRNQWDRGRGGRGPRGGPGGRQTRESRGGNFIPDGTHNDSTRPPGPNATSPANSEK